MQGEWGLVPRKELIEKHRANWPATRSNNTLSTHELWRDPALVKVPFLSVLCSFPPLYIRIYILHHFTFHKSKHQKKEKMKWPWFSTKMVGGDGMRVLNSPSSWSFFLYSSSCISMWHVCSYYYLLGSSSAHCFFIFLVVLYNNRSYKLHIFWNASIFMM